MKKRFVGIALSVAMVSTTIFGGVYAFAEEEAVAGHEIYSLMTQTLDLAGITDPDTPDRSDIDKAWPKERASEDTVTIGWTEINQSSDWFISVKESAEAAAEEYGYDLNFQIAEDDTAKQSQQVDDFITMGVDIIVLDPVNSSAPVADINRAVAAGIPVLCTGAVPEDCAALTTLCSNTFLNGWEVGKYTAAQFAADEDIKATMLVGVMGSSCTESRLAGALAGMLYGKMEQKGTPYACKEDAWMAGHELFQEIKTSGKGAVEDAGLYILGYGTGSWTVEGGLAASEDLVTANGSEMNCLLAENDFMADGGIKALKSAGIDGDVLVCAVADGTTAGLELIKAGDLLCTGLNSGLEQGHWAIDFIHAIFDEGADPNNLPLGSFFTPGVIDADNVDDYYVEDSKFYKSQDFVFPPSIPEIKGE